MRFVRIGLGVRIAIRRVRFVCIGLGVRVDIRRVRFVCISLGVRVDIRRVIFYSPSPWGEGWGGAKKNFRVNK